MPRSERQRQAQPGRVVRRQAPPERSARRWWWLAVPLLGVAAWAAFSATLSLLGDDGHAPPPDADAPVRRLVMPPAAVPAAMVPPATDGGAPSPAGVAAEASDAGRAPEAAAAPTTSVSPEVVATPGAQRAAAATKGPRTVKPKRAPSESLTEQDRRALDALVEQAGKKAR